MTSIVSIVAMSIDSLFMLVKVFIIIQLHKSWLFYHHVEGDDQLPLLALLACDNCIRNVLQALRRLVIGLIGNFSPWSRQDA